MGWILSEGGNLYEKAGAIKRKRPKKAPSRAIASPIDLGRKLELACQKPGK
jgi:hypothetical protein